MVTKNAEVVSNGRGQLFAQVAENREYVCWMLDSADVTRFNLREYDEIVIAADPQDQYCQVVGFQEQDS